jgi:hypothetical protein
MMLRRIVIETIVGVVVTALSLFALLVEAGIVQEVWAPTIWR